MRTTFTFRVRIAALALAILMGPLRPASGVDAGQQTHSPGSPGLVLRDLSGREQNLKDYLGKIVVLNFWATWCVPCRHEMPVLISLQERYRQEGVEVIGASADPPSARKPIARFVSQMKINFTIWVGASSADMERFRLGTALPATVIVDRDGEIVGRILGPVEEADLRNRLEWLLGGRASRPPPPLVNNFERLPHDHAGEQKTHAHGEHEGEENHHHGTVSIEGASTVPS